ncbi:MAG TPA: primosomal protein N', partial [Chitinophagales bacterium]|nr:primosomal protein N' [Chitinophagales bacterium]
MSLYADILLPLAVPDAYTYSVPAKWRDKAKIGMRVEVQLGKKKIYSGIIAALKDSYDGTHVIKPILNIPDDDPVVYPAQLKLWQWMAEYYCCNMGEVMNAALPAGLKLESETTITLNPTFAGDYTSLTDREYLVAEALEVQQELTITEVTQLLQTRSVNPVIDALVKKNVVIVSEAVTKAFKPRTTTWLQLADSYSDEAAFHELLDSLEKKQKQLDVLLAYVQLSKKYASGGLVKKKELLENKKLSPGSLQTLVKNGILIAEEKPESEDPDFHQPVAFDLSFAQLQAQAEIVQSFEDKNVTLLHGVTGSGKTNVYIRLIEQTQEQG